MQQKKRLHKHLLLIYIFYFVALIVGLVASFAPQFTAGWREAGQTLDNDLGHGSVRTYYVNAPVAFRSGEGIEIEGLPENVTLRADEITMSVSVPETYTLRNSFRVMANNGCAYLLSMLRACSYLAVLVLIALIINSLRKSIRDEQPLRRSNIGRTRTIGILILAAALCGAFEKWINIREATRLLADTSFEVASTFPLDYWDVIVGILFLFMAEVIAIGRNLSEEQKLTI